MEDTVKIVESFNEPRIKLINYDNNGIISASRNLGIEKSTGRILAFLDSDDYWHPQKLCKCVAKISEGNDVICHAEVWTDTNQSHRIVKYGPEERVQYTSLLLEGNCLSTSAIVVRRELVDEVGRFSTNPDFVTAEDYDLWLRLALRGAKFRFISEPLGVAFIHVDGNSRNYLRNINAITAVFEKHIETLCNIPNYRKRRARALIFYGGARMAQKMGQRRESIRLFFTALSTYPFIWRAYLGVLLAALKVKL
jgi:teichuronic acid biosynthesis glycosyltransferase TuaG